MKTKFTIAMIALLVSSLGANAQEKDSVETSISCDLMSRYVWRGSQYSRTPSIQPCFELSYKGFVFGTWGAYSFNGAEGAEADLYVSYSFAKEMFSVLVTDYFLPNEYSDNNYFEYCEEHTGHLLEGTLSFNGTEKLPLSFLVAANFYGADKKKLNDDPNSPDFNQPTGNMYSAYLELGYSLETKDGTSIDIFAGFAPNEPKKANQATGFIGETGYYGKYMGFVNIGFKAEMEIKISSEYNLPINFSLITNPMSENVFLVFGISL